MLAGKLTFIGSTTDRKIYRFDLPKPDGLGNFTEYRGRTFIVREDGSHIETPPVEHFQSEDEATAWLNGS